MHHAVRSVNPLRGYRKWTQHFPNVYRTAVLGQDGPGIDSPDDDDECLATLKHFRSLLDMSKEAQKPAFSLRPADGAMGAHMYAAHDCYRDFAALAKTIAERCGVVW